MIALLLTIVAAAPLPKGADQKPDQLDGEWTLVSMVRDGEALPEAQGKRYRLTVRDDKWMVEVGAATRVAFTLSLDSPPCPKSIDLTSPGGASVLRGVYKLDGETLTTCLAGTGLDRPAGFKTGQGTTLAVWKRAGK